MVTRRGFKFDFDLSRDAPADPGQVTQSGQGEVQP